MRAKVKQLVDAKVRSKLNLEPDPHLGLRGPKNFLALRKGNLSFYLILDHKSRGDIFSWHILVEERRHSVSGKYEAFNLIRNETLIPERWSRPWMHFCFPLEEKKGWWGVRIYWLSGWDEFKRPMEDIELNIDRVVEEFYVDYQQYGVPFIQRCIDCYEKNSLANNPSLVLDGSLALIYSKHR
jgi:hypothetical protein